MEDIPEPLDLQLKRAFFTKLSHSDKHLQTNINAAVDKSTGECPSDFKCNICLQLVHIPEECGNCDQLFCKDCIAGWRAKGKSACPLCQSSLNLQQINRILRKYLDATVLKGCPADGCGLGEITYEKLHSHLEKDCVAMPVTCPHCQASFLRGKWEFHYDECPAIQLACQNCGIGGISRKEFASHNCIKALQTKLGEHEKLIRQQQEDIEALNTKFVEFQKYIVEKIQQLDDDDKDERVTQQQPVRAQPIGGFPPQNYFGAMGGGRQFSKPFGMLGNKRVFRENAKVYCNQHMRELVHKPGFLSAWHKCDLCKRLLKDIGQGEYWECRTCDLDFCRGCLQNNANFGH